MKLPSLAPCDRVLSPLALAALWAGDAAGQGTYFEDVSLEVGVHVEHEDGPLGYGMGGGAAWFDADRDGDDDLLVTSSDGAHRVYRRDGADFTEMTPGSGVTGGGAFGSNMGVSCADYDGDGWVDVYLTNNGPNQLLRNLGNFTFEDVAPLHGVDDDAWSTSASWADFDGDGDLDLYVGNYIETLNFPYHYGAPNRLYLNRGAGVTPRFSDRAAQLGVADTGIFGPSVDGYSYVSPEGEATAGCTLSVCTLDYDEDGDPDLMVGNDFGLWTIPDRQWRNDTPPGGPLAFTEVTESTAFSQGAEYNMGILGRDYDHDGDWDLYLSNLGDNLLLRNDGPGPYVNAVESAGPVEGLNDAGTLLLSSWGTVWEDFDNDGWEDLYVVNGYIPAAAFIANDSRAANHLWRNRGDGTFERVDPVESGLADQGAGRGVAWTDANGDGLLDLYLMNNGAGGIGQPGDSCKLFLNRGGMGDPSHRWLGLRLRGRFGQAEALGTRVDLRAGSLELKRQALGDPVYLSSPTRALHFGLGSAVWVDSLRFHWASGRESEWVGVPSGAAFTVVEPAVTLEEVGAPTWSAGVFTLPYEIANDSSEDVLAFGLVQILLPGGDVPLATLGWAVDAPAGAQIAAAASAPVNATLHDAVEGLDFVQRVYVVALGSIDSRVAGFVMP